MQRQWIFLSLAVIGAVVPYAAFLDYFAELGFDADALTGFVPALFANGAVAGFTADLLISSVVFWIWMVSDVRSAEVSGSADAPSIWPFVLLNLTIGLSCALPAYLWRRERLAAAAGH